MYLISPFIVKWMYESKKPWVPVFLITSISLGIRAALIYNYYPDAATNQDAFDEKDQFPVKFFNLLYSPMYTRISPYCFGMWAAYAHLNGFK